MQAIKIKISGMTCSDCAQSAQDALNAVEGVTATVSYETGLAEIKTNINIEQSLLLKAIESMGYTASLINSDDSTSNDKENQLQIAIVGTGSGAFAAAIKAVERGAQVTLIEGADVIGGTCVNVGCVPSKIFIRAANIAHKQGHHRFKGIALNTPKIDRKAMMLQQQEYVANLRHAKYESILENNPDINLVRGLARFKDSKTLIVKASDGSEKEITADRILIAVGARPLIPEIDGLSDTPYWTSTEALVAAEIPQHLVILGGSVVALELAQAFRHLGAQVTVMARSTFLSKEDPDIGAGVKEAFESEGIQVRLHSVPTLINHNGKKFTVFSQHGKIDCDQLLVATGRQSNSDTLGLNQIGVDTTENGNIIINNQMRTSVDNVYAAGDCSTQPQFVYVAAAGGTRAARNMTGDNVSLDLSILPAVIFTDPQVATVGISEQQANAQGLEIKVRKLDIEHVPRAIANFDTRGFIKLVAEKDNGQIVGCQVLANEAGEIIQTAALAIRNKMTIEDLANQLFPYLTMVEGLKLCAQTFYIDVKQLSCCAG